MSGPVRGLATAPTDHERKQARAAALALRAAIADPATMGEETVMSEANWRRVEESNS